MSRKAFSIHSDFYDELSALDPASRGDVVSALIAWASDADIPELNPACAMLFRLMTAQIERFSAKNASNGAKGGKSAKKSEPSEESEESEGRKNKPPVTITVPITVTKTVPISNMRTLCAGDVGFDEFWKAYPRKKSKGDAEKAWKSVKPSKELVATMLEKLARAKTCHDWTKEGGKYIPYPASWLRAKGWEDEIRAECASRDSPPKKPIPEQQYSQREYDPTKYTGFTPEEIEEIKKL